MNYTVVKYLLLSCILLYSNNFQASACFIPEYKFEVCVINQLPPNIEPYFGFTVHPKTMILEIVH
ncbi:hypothetical protein PHJA_001593000 [Phtheirospermum japonicum]|uniref:Uncharacterized protein n=1 Tax=Phtheirospermum japonicum TaxID=374723 RepID=A0A830C5T7_9LAMI|nr:hypothetical protein PHJA_001593000 [Phtheirospermum japonicum]